MKNIIVKSLLLASALLMVFLQVSPAYAGTCSATESPMPTIFTFGGTSTLTYAVKNTSAVGTTKMYRVYFNLANNTYTSIPTTLVYTAPAGWTCTRRNATQIRCATSGTGSASNIVSGGTGTFSVNVSNVITTQDSSDKFNTVQCRFTDVSGTYVTASPLQSAWTWKSLLMTLAPSLFNVGANCPFTLTMTVTNKTTSNITAPNYVTSQPKPPLITVLSGGPIPTTGSTPADFTLNSGSTGTMVWAYNSGATAGTFNLSSYARDSTSIRTSSTVTTGTITVSGVPCNFIVSSLTVTPNCLLSGSTATFTMVVSNTT
jgi:hypothetical protein